MTASLSVESIDFGYGRHQVLFDVSLHVHAGESLALVGTNGAGKSTLLRVASGLERPWSGRVVLGGDDITGMPAEIVVGAGLALIQGGRAIFPDLSVKENLEIQALTARQAAGLGGDRFAKVFEAFPALRDCLGRPASSLSGGQQQMVALAKALLLQPKTLCIDELSLGLAPVIVQRLLDVVRALRATGMTLLIVEQSLSIAATVCDRAVFLEKGAVRFEGQVNDLLQNDDIARAVFFGAGGSGHRPRPRGTSTATRSRPALP